MLFRSIGFKVQDNGGTANGGADTSINAYILTIDVTAVNDAPLRTAGTITALTVNEDFSNSTAVTLGLSGLNYGPGGGADEATQTLTYTITSIPSFITLWKADGVTQVTTTTTGLTQADIQGLKYKTVADAKIGRAHV